MIHLVLIQNTVSSFKSNIDIHIKIIDSNENKRH